MDRRELLKALMAAAGGTIIADKLPALPAAAPAAAAELTYMGVPVERCEGLDAGHYYMLGGSTIVFRGLPEAERWTGIERPFRFAEPFSWDDDEIGIHETQP